jgi:uncharacterized protein (TIGR02217 family)
MAFHEVQFPSDISYGSSGGPRRLTQIVPLRSGFEQRNQIWAHSRRSYDAGLGVRSLDQLATSLAFWEARNGALYGFRWKDWADYKSGLPSAAVTNADQLLGLGTGALTTFQLLKRYTSGGYEYARPIKKPVTGTVVVSVNSVAQPTGWTVDTTTGIITFTTAPANGHAVRAGFEFDVPVRFDEDSLDISIEGFQAGAIPSIKVIEIRV